MAAGKNGWKCGVVLKMTLICLICMTLFHSGNADEASRKEFCDELKGVLQTAGKDAEKFGLALGVSAASGGGKHKDGLACYEGTDLSLLGGNIGCMIDVDLKKVNDGIAKGGGGTVCESKKCVLPKGGYTAVCGGPANPSKSNSSKLQAMVVLITAVMLVELCLRQLMS